MDYMPSLHTHVSTLQLRNPCINASGPMGWFMEYSSLIPYHHLGGFVLKGLSRERRSGTEGKRVLFLPQGMINAIGLENPGVNSFLHSMYPAIVRQYQRLFPQGNFPLIANIAGGKEDDYAFLSEKLDGLSEIQALEINVSCPNMDSGGLHFIQDAQLLRKIIRKLRSISRKVLIVKLPYLGRIELRKIVSLLLDEGVDAISAINTVASDDFSISHLNLPSFSGGLSGAYIHFLALKMLRNIRSYCSIPIIAVGGVVDFSDFLRFFRAGATAVGIGTGIFLNPEIFSNIFFSLLSFMQKKGIGCMDEFCEYTTIHKKDVEN